MKKYEITIKRNKFLFPPLLCIYKNLFRSVKVSKDYFDIDNLHKRTKTPMSISEKDGKGGKKHAGQEKGGRMSE